MRERAGGRVAAEAAAEVAVDGVPPADGLAPAGGVGPVTVEAAVAAAKRRRRLRALTALLVLVVGAAAVVHGPGLLRGVDAFAVERVEVVGTRFTEPYAVVRAAGIDHESNLFDDAGAWRRGVLELPLVLDARVRRRPPGTLSIEVTEVEPVALVADGALRPIDVHGRALPLDPAGIVLDLPVLAGVTLADDTLTGAGEAALGVLLLLRAHDAAWADRVSQAELVGGGVRLTFRGDGPDALLPLDASPVHLLQLRLAFADLAGRGELGRVGRIDVRFRDQVVVSFLRRS